MPSWLRALGKRAALLCALVGTVLATHVAVDKPDLPFAVLECFDRTFAQAYEVAERRVAELEAARPSPPRREVFALLRELERAVTAACDAASTRLDVELVVAGWLPPDHRRAVAGCIE